MRRFLLLLLLSFASLLSEAQVPNFPFDSTQWFVWNTLAGNSLTVYSTGSDTVLSGKTYTCIWSDFYDNTTSDTNNLELFIRPDSSNKVWFRYSSLVSTDTNEYVLYDFSLQVGDTFHIKNLTVAIPYSIIVGVTMTGQLNDATPVNIIQFNSNGCLSYEFVEMVGCTTNPFYPLFGTTTAPDTCEPILECEKINGICQWGTASYCQVGVGVNELPKSSCSPRKVGESENEVYYVLDCQGKTNVSVTVYDLAGRILFKKDEPSERIMVPIQDDQLLIVHFEWGVESSSLLISK